MSGTIPLEMLNESSIIDFGGFVHRGAASFFLGNFPMQEFFLYGG